ncbi:MAG TPA: tetratricopeptide repeat protein [Terriglobia bacterium]|nr:tetratricopeptide repeat protein [Terriglobia bacterium]
MRTRHAPICLALAVLWPLPAAAAPAQAGSAAPRASSFEQLSRAAEHERNQNHDDDAIALYQRALKLQPEWDEGLWNLSSLLYEKERYAEARDWLRRFVADQPKAGMGWALLGLSEFRTREYARALDHLRQGMTLGTGGSKGMARSVFYYAAVLLTRFEMYDQSQRLLFEMARSGQEESFLVEPLGLAALRMPLLPEEIPSDRHEMIRLAGEGALAVNDQHQDQAEKLFRQMTAAYPHEPGVHFLFGAFLMNARPEDGIQEMKRELEISPFHVPARVRLAEEYVKEGQVDQALALAAEAAKLDPQGASAHLAWGQAFVAKSDLPSAIRELETARDQEPEDLGIRWALFRAYTAMGRSAEAGKEKDAIEKLAQPRSQQ